MKFFFTLSLFVTLLSADYINGKALACVDKHVLQKAAYKTEGDLLKLNLYAMKNNCHILDKKDRIKAEGFDVASSKALIIQVLYKKTSQLLYIYRKAVHIERAGEKNTIRF